MRQGAPHSPIGGDRLKKAVQRLSELVEEYPQISRKHLLYRVQMQFDLSPVECEFLDKHFANNDDSPRT
jgi:hypothetical protein